jgi:hypothetical protein
MNDTPTTAHDDEARPIRVAPLLPLALLESIRAHDKPREVLEEEDLSASLPRRLGLTGVVDAQIRHYEEARRRRRAVPAEPVADLLRLILRRPDSADILREAGAGVARRHFGGSQAALAAGVRFLPGRVRHRAIRRSAARMFERVAGDGLIEVAPPLRLRVTGGLMIGTDPTGGACVLFEGALEELSALYLGKRPRARHDRCAASGSPACEWEVTP